MYYKIKTMLQLIGNLVHMPEPASLSTHRLYLKKYFFVVHLHLPQGTILHNSNIVMRK